MKTLWSAACFLLTLTRGGVPRPTAATRLLRRGVRHVLVFVASVQAVIYNSAIIARLNGIQIRHVMRRGQRDTVQRGRPLAAAVKIRSIVRRFQEILRISRLIFEDFLGDDIKPCPRCQVLIVKIDDGSCNHMVCAVCGSEFCWLCKKEITDLHYLSPSGCTFWGTKPWSRKKKLLWQLGTLVGAPVMIALVAGIAVPAMIIGKLNFCHQNSQKILKN